MFFVFVFFLGTGLIGSTDLNFSCFHLLVSKIFVYTAQLFISVIAFHISV